MTQTVQDPIEQLISQGRELVAQAQAALARSDQFFSEQGIDVAECEQYMREHAADPDVQAAHARVAAIRQKVEDEVRRDHMHGAGSRARVSPRLRAGGV